MVWHWHRLPRGLWSLCTCRYSEFDRTWPWATCPNKAGLQSWHYFEQGLNHMAFRGPVHLKLLCDPAHFCVNVSLILAALSFNFATFDRFSARVFSHISGILTPRGNIWVYEWAQEGRRLCFIAASCPSLGWCQTQTSPVCRPHPAAVASKATPGALVPHHPPRAQEKLSLQHLHIFQTFNSHQLEVKATRFGLPFSSKPSSWSSCSVEVWRLVY